MTLAIFDLDNTLLPIDSDYAWCQFAGELGIVDAESYGRQGDSYYDDYCRGKLNIVEYQQFVVAPLAGVDPNQLASWHAQFMRKKIEMTITPKALSLVESHRSQGHTLMIITATNTFIAAPIAERFGIKHLLATMPEQINGVFTGKLTGIPCYREGKVQRLALWLEEHHESLDGSFFYSDSHNDLPLLKQVDNPVAVNPDERLRTYAQAHNWPEISLR